MWQRGCTVVALLPALLHTDWWHEYVMRADELYYLRDKVCFANPFVAGGGSDYFYSMALASRLPQLFAGFRTMLRPGGCAQLCNDAATDYTDDDLAYLKHINVAMLFFADGDGVVFYAKKPIKRGDELLFSYGAEYWQIRRVRALFGSQQVLT